MAKPVQTAPVALLVAYLATVTPARADDAALGAAMRGYYDGELVSAYVIGSVGLAGAAAGGVLVTRATDFERGLGWPLLTLGALDAVGGAFYALQVHSEIDHYGSLLARDSAAFQREEAAHIAGTTRRFIAYRIAELTLTVAGAGVAIYGFAADKDAFKGAGIGTFGMALPLLVIDTINNGRATGYRDLLARNRAGLAVSPAAHGHGLVVSFGGTL